MREGGLASGVGVLSEVLYAVIYSRNLGGAGKFGIINITESILTAGHHSVVKIIIRLKIKHMTKTYLPSVKEAEQTRKWHHLDASGQVLGRMATKAAVLLMGKHKKTFTPHMDCGDFVVVTNIKDIKVTGDKMNQKVYFTHSGYAKGGKEIPFKRKFENDPSSVFELAVKRMLDENKLRAPRMKRLKLFNGAEHTFTGQFAKGAK